MKLLKKVLFWVAIGFLAPPALVALAWLMNGANKVQ